MPDPLVVQVVRSFKRALLDREAEAMALMGKRWLEVEKALKFQLQAVADEMTAMQAAGEVVTDSVIYQNERFQALVAQVQYQVSIYEQWATQQIAGEQRALAGLGIEDAIAAIRAAGVRADFNVLPVSATEAMAGLAGDGSPLFDILKERALWPEAVDGLAAALVKGIAEGQNPRATALLMADGLTEGLNKALTIARTETLRSYRLASVEQYRASGVVKGFRRLASKDGNTCPACLMLDGQRFRLSFEMTDHPNGRCTCVPDVIGAPEIQWQTGRQWFEGLGAEKQREILGPGYYDAWQAGKFGLDDLATMAHSDTWGDSPQVKPLSKLAA